MWVSEEAKEELASGHEAGQRHGGPLPLLGCPMVSCICSGHPANHVHGHALAFSAVSTKCQHARVSNHYRIVFKRRGSPSIFLSFT